MRGDMPRTTKACCICSRNSPLLTSLRVAAFLAANTAFEEVSATP